MATGAIATIALGPADEAAAAPVQGFLAGNIVPDSTFFNANAMDEGQIQNFLNSRVSSCRSGYVCLKDFRQDTRSRGADPMCRALAGGSNESAARIIIKAAQACGINPQTLIVLLQKEQGLVTDTWPTERQYRVATGYGCPDTAPCDAEYFGFANQVYQAAWAFKRYTQPPGTGAGTNWSTRFDLRYPVGQNTDVLYNPAASCGTQRVYIENRASHALYIYTPYVPNAAALNAGYGRGDGCSAYGNRNFYLYFSDWFGIQRFEVSGSIGDYWRSQGGSSGWLGEPQAPSGAGSGGWWQRFAGGTVTIRNGASIVIVSGALGDRYEAIGAGGSSLGLPISSAETVAGGWRQRFQNGWLMSSASGTWDVAGSIGTEYNGQNVEAGTLGWPIAAQRCGLRADGCYQDFVAGSIHSSPTTGAFHTGGAIRETWAAAGWEQSPLGYPRARAEYRDGAWVQLFEGGQISWSPDRGNEILPLPGPIADAYAGLGNARGWLGSVVTRTYCGLSGGGCYQQFAQGSIHWSPTTGAVPTSGAVRAAWEAAGWESGAFGYPTASAEQVVGGAMQAFQNGRVFVRPDGRASWLPNGALLERYLSNGGPASALGWPTGEHRCGLRNDGCFASFDGGSMHATVSTLPVRTSGAVRATWEATGWESGYLGYPVEDVVDTAGGVQQRFQGGRIFVRADGRAFAVANGEVLAAYLAAGGPGGALGWPNAPYRCGLVRSGCYLEAENGSVHAFDGRPGVVTAGAVRSLWEAAGWEAGLLGYPIAPSAVDAQGVVTQRFQGGLARVQSSGTAWVSIGADSPISSLYDRLGNRAGYLGLPTTPQHCGLRQGGCYQAFANGSIHWTAGTGAVGTSGTIRAFWEASGWESGRLGYPLSAVRSSAGGEIQQFEGGTVYAIAGGGVHAVYNTAVRAAYSSAGGESGALGWPETTERCGLRSGGCFQKYANGSIHWSPSTGAHATSGAIRDVWESTGWESGPLGYPIGDASAANGVTRQRFEGGTVSWTPGQPANWTR